MTEHETNLRDLAAMFAMAALLTRNSPKEAIVSLAFEMADMFMEARILTPEDGIAGLKPKRKEPK
jgi:hypothetical protein